MRTRQLTKYLPAVWLFAWVQAAMGQGAPGYTVPADFCAFAQGIIAETALVPDVAIYTDREAFIDSKPADIPFTVAQMADLPTGPQAIPTVVSCKMRTAERINSAHALEDGSGSAPAGAESSCDEVHRRVLAQAIAAVPETARAVKPGDWVVEEEQLTFMGPSWLEPWPFVPVTRDDAGKLHLYTRALYVPYAWWIPMPESFLGNYYCHLATPGYVEALVRGDLDAPLAQP